MDTDGQYALVTGASSGIGRELAWKFAENGFDLLVCAEDSSIESVAADLSQSGAHVEALRVDLRKAADLDKLCENFSRSTRPLDAVALNAGVGQGGAFVDSSIVSQLEVIDLNVRSTVQLAHFVLRGMIARGSGRVLVTSSIASTMPGSFQSVYNASKSFLQSFGEALQNELKGSDVTLTLLMLGPTDTEFFERAGMEDTAVGQGSKDDPADVARQGFEALMAGDKRVVSSSIKTKVQEMANRVIPDQLKAELHRKMAEPGSGKD